MGHPGPSSCAKTPSKLTSCCLYHVPCHLHVPPPYICACDLSELCGAPESLRDPRGWQELASFSENHEHLATSSQASCCFLEPGNAFEAWKGSLHLFWQTHLPVSQHLLWMRSGLLSMQTLKNTTSNLLLIPPRSL